MISGLPHGPGPALSPRGPGTVPQEVEKIITSIVDEAKNV